jgi:hypothetical protein
MRGSTKTIKQVHMHMPAIRDMKHWAVKLLSNEKTTDTALLTMAVMLCGWLLYCLAKPISECRYLL